MGLAYITADSVRFQDVYLVHILNELAGNSFMVFCGTCNTTLRLSLLLNALGLPVRCDVTHPWLELAWGGMFDVLLCVFLWLMLETGNKNLWKQMYTRAEPYYW